MLYPVSDNKKNEIVRENKMIHLRMSATEGWVSVTDALDYLWHKIYDCDPPQVRLEQAASQVHLHQSLLATCSQGQRGVCGHSPGQPAHPV